MDKELENYDQSWHSKSSKPVSVLEVVWLEMLGIFHTELI